MQRVVAFFISLLFFISVKAQEIILSGKVTNEKNEAVAGATIKVINGATVVTNAEGHYSIKLQVNKKYEVEASGVGFVTKKISDVTVAAGGDNELNIMLEFAKRDMDEVVVKTTSRRQENTNALISFQKNNTALSSVLAADFIKRTPDKNTGEVLRRVSGASIQDNKFVIVRGLSDRYNAALINGATLPSSEPDKKAFSFDVIPSNLIDNIIINKTATPDFSGEFAGGLVQINTKDIPTSSQLTVNVGLGFNTQSVFKDFVRNPAGTNEKWGFAGERKLPAGYPANMSGYDELTYDQRVALAKSFNGNAYQQQNSTAAPVQQYALTWSNVAKFKNGGTLGSIVGLTYRSSKLLYTATKELYETGTSGQAFFDYTDLQNKYSVNAGAIANIAYAKGKHKIAFKNLLNQLLDDNYYTRTGINTENIQDVSLRSSVLNQRSLLSSQLEGTHGIGVRGIKLQWNLNYAYNNKQQPDLRVLTYGKSMNVNEPYSANLRGNNTNRFFSKLEDHAAGYNASLLIPFELGSQKQTLKIGGSNLTRFRNFRAVILGFTEPDNTALLTLPYDKIFAADNFGGNGFMLSTTLQNPQDKYFGISSLSAGYFMFDNKLSDNIRLIWGSRFEYFEQFLKSNTQGTDKAQIVNTDKFDFLPSANLTLTLNPKNNLRVGISRTVARPEFREIAPFSFFDFEQIASTTGTPDLKRSSIINADIRFERYPRAGELLSFGAFYKYFTDAIELRLNSASAATRRIYQFQNADNANLFGFEAEFRKSLSFLNDNADWLNRLYVNGNASLIYSKVTLGNMDASGNKLPATERPLQGQSPYLINAGLQYDGEKGSSFSLLYNRIGERLSLVGNNDFGDIYEKARDLVDIQFSQKLLKNKGELRLTISDLLNAPYKTFENRNDKKTFQSETDRQFSSYKPGTTISVGFTYNIGL